MSKCLRLFPWIIPVSLFLLIIPGFSQSRVKEIDIDERVQAFLAKMQGRWYDMNVPQTDGEILYRLIIENGYKKALEIGTSTGRSGIYIAWALSKTGGRLTTIEIDEGRYREAAANFKEAGLSETIDARLADAHELVPELPGSFDFVFIDADKHWYTNYARAVVPKLEPGGCIAAHNVTERRGRWGGYGGTGDYYEYMKSLPGFRSRILSESRGGLSVSIKGKSD
ncbi:MAG: class I SAM-dependent methyltransferase [Candidatus Aminicenantes bacterium]|nr:class I SAM-dependent methyltransferase [Candidatus Aminicenantes bacterium]